MLYDVAFDIADQRYPGWDFVAPGALMVVVGLIVRRSGRGGMSSRVFVNFFLGLALASTIGVFLGTWPAYHRLLAAVRAGDVQVEEGAVHDFRPMPYTGHALERFCVQQACFAYSDFQYSAGFHQSRSHGGPVHEGIPVRVTHVGDTIVKLEIGRGAN